MTDVLPTERLVRRARASTRFSLMRIGVFAGAAARLVAVGLDGVLHARRAGGIAAHDLRAPLHEVFHFLTDPTDRTAYIERLRRSVKPGGTVIIATFAPDGPEKCSGLQVRRYDAAALRAQLGAGFLIVDAPLEQHRTPSGATQSFCYAVFRRGGS